MSIITLSGIEKVYRTKEIETTALENVNLEVNEGEFLSIMGPSGCGKSTFLNIIGLLDKATKGSVSILGNDCSTMSDRELSHFRNANIGFVFQSFHLIPSLDVASNVELPLIYRKGISAAQRRERIEKVLERLDMSHRIHHLPSQLSGGQCQRVAIARAIVGGRELRRQLLAGPKSYLPTNRPATSTAKWVPRSWLYFTGSTKRTASL